MCRVHGGTQPKDKEKKRRIDATISARMLDRSVSATALRWRWRIASIDAMAFMSNGTLPSDSMVAALAG